MSYKRPMLFDVVDTLLGGLHAPEQAANNNFKETSLSVTRF